MPIKNFSQYLIEEEREVYFTFGRMNPPTIGHGKLLDVLAAKSRKSDYKVYLSQTQNANKDPLSYSDKIKHARKMFPKHARNIILDKKVKTVFHVLVELYDQGYRKVNMVVGSDRVREFDKLLAKYNGIKASHGFYEFVSINVISAGARDPDAEGVEGMSASKQRENAKNNDFVSFSQGVPKSLSNADTRKLFNAVRVGMGLKELKEFRNHVELAPVSETREKFVQGELFTVGDLVQIKETKQVVKVTHLGANYIIVESNNFKKRMWLDAVQCLDEAASPQDQDIKDREGTQPARYHKGLSKATKIARDRQFKKQSKMADDNPKAYKPAPGDKSATTKPSKYTKAFKDMYKENAGDEGSDKLRKAYIKDTPGQKDLEEKAFRTWAQSFASLKSKTISKDKYNKVAQHALKQMKDSKRGHEYHARDVIRKYNLKGMDTHALADRMRELQSA